MGRCKFNLLEKIDYFGQGMSFTIGGNERIGSRFGGLMTVAASFLTLVYTVVQFLVMVNYSGTSF